MRVTRKNIVKAICEKTGINPRYLDMHHNGYGYYFYGEAAHILDAYETYPMNITDWDIDRWVKQFERYMGDRTGDHVNREIESIDWSL